MSADADDHTAVTGGGIVWMQKISPNQPICVDASLRVARPTDQVTAEVFVADSDNFSTDKGTSSNEFLWLYQAGQAKIVLPGDGALKSRSAAEPRFQWHCISIRIALERDAAIVSQQSKAIWSGGAWTDHIDAPLHRIAISSKTAATKSPEPALAFTPIRMKR